MTNQTGLEPATSRFQCEVCVTCTTGQCRTGAVNHGPTRVPLGSYGTGEPLARGQKSRYRAKYPAPAPQGRCQCTGCTGCVKRDRPWRNLFFLPQEWAGTGTGKGPRGAQGCPGGEGTLIVPAWHGTHYRTPPWPPTLSDVRTEPHRAGLHRAGLHRAGLHRAGLHRAGLHRTAPGRPLHRTEPHRAGPAPGRPDDICGGRAGAGAALPTGPGSLRLGAGGRGPGLGAGAGPRLGSGRRAAPQARSDNSAARAPGPITCRLSAEKSPARDAAIPEPGRVHTLQGCRDNQAGITGPGA